jgi:NitT/TauT family transport system substrate-binding protein
MTEKTPIRESRAHGNATDAVRVEDFNLQTREHAHFLERRRLLRGAAAFGAIGLSTLLGTTSRAAKSEKPLKVGGLPVTCNLTLPTACEAAKAATGQQLFEYSKYNGWPEVKESLMAGSIAAAYMLAPLVMDLRDKKIPVKIVSLGHRSGAVIMVRTESPYKNFKSLTGKRVAIPSRFAVDYLFLRKMLAREGMDAKDIVTVEMPPPDMPAALYANAVDAYCTGEPFGAVAQRAGYARPLSMTRDHWPKYMCCVLTVREELIADDPVLVQRLVDYVQAVGSWMDVTPANRDKAVNIAAGRKFFNQDPEVLRYVMENPKDRVTYGDLRLIKSEFDDLMQLSIQAGTIKHPILYETYVDERFVKSVKPAVIKL